MSAIHKLSKNKEAAGVRRKLLVLCKGQLHRIRNDANERFAEMTSHGLSATELTTQLLKDIQLLEADTAVRERITDYVHSLKKLAECLVVDCQFFDEFAQRLVHIEDAIEDYQHDDYWAQGDDVALEKLAHQFGTRSEYDEFVKVFPEADKESPRLNFDSVELY